MIRPVLSALALAATLLAAAPVAAAPDAVDTAAQGIQKGLDTGDVGAILKARAQLAAQSAADVKSARLHAWTAFVDWRAVPMLRRDRAQAEKLCQDGIDHCDQALAINAKLADVLALKAGLQGMMIGFRPSEVMTLGPGSEANLQRAAAIDSLSPRVWLLDGIGTLNKPPAFGGGAAKAAPKLARAQALFAAKRAPDAIGFAWGESDAWTWGGRAAVALKDYAGAKAQYARSLEVNPSNGWVRMTLMPEADSLSAASVKP